MLPIIGTVMGIISKVIPDQDKQAELQKEIMKHQADIESKFVEYAKMDHELRIKELEHKGFKSWWRPLAMFGLTTFILFYLVCYYLLPIVVVYFNLNVYMPQINPLPDIVWQVYAFCLVGLGGMRTFEKYKRK